MKSVLRAIGSPGFPEDETILNLFCERHVRRNYHPPGAARQLIAIAASGDRTKAVRRITAPTLVIHGKDDPLVPVACGIETSREIPNAKLSVIAGMGHDLPTSLHERLAEFLSVPLNAAVFNLGYLPGGDKKLITLPEQTLAALAAASFLLYGGFFRGRFDTGTEDRYALTVLLPLSVAAASALGPAAAPAALLAAGLSWRAPEAPPAEHEASRRFLERSSPLIPERAYVAAFNPPFVREVAGRPAAAAYLLLEDLPAFEASRARAGADPRLVLYKDWAWRSRPEEAARLEKALEPGYEASPLAGDGLDSLILLTPRPRAPR